MWTLTAQIIQLHRESKGRYGAARIHAELRRKGPTSRPQAGRALDKEGRSSREDSEAVEQDTVHDASAAVPVDLVRRDFTVDAAKLNSRCVATSPTSTPWEGWLYLSTVIDIASRRVVG